MKVTSARFVKSAAAKPQWPALAFPQIAFAGRSNVGKSSLINALTSRKGLALVSKTPGKTQLLNFFVINEKFTIVDMPGYGFAKAPESVRAGWGKLVETFLRESGQLKGVVALVDIRRTPGDDDLKLLEWLDHYRVPFVLVFTKADKVPKGRRQAMARQSLAVMEPLLGQMAGSVLFSTHTGEGRDELWAAVRRLLEEAPEPIGR